MTSARIGLAFFCLFGLSALATAQTLYRCGNAYQDRPCESASNEKIIGAQPKGASTATSSPQGSGSAAAAGTAGAGYTPSSGDLQRCQARGAQAEKIMWAREGGATLQKQLQDSDHPVNRSLATDVYARHGTAAEVRTSVEKDCIADTERSLEAARLNAAAADILAGNHDSAGQDQTPRAVTTATTAVHPGPSTAVSVSTPADRCDRLNAQATSIAAQQRSGGSRATLDTLNASALQNQNDRRSAGC